MDGLPSIRYKKCVVLIVLHKYHPVVDIQQHTAVLQWSTCPRWYEAKLFHGKSATSSSLPATGSGNRIQIRCKHPISLSGGILTIHTSVKSCTDQLGIYRRVLVKKEAKISVLSSICLAMRCASLPHT
jgi:hypothetical protein